MRQQKKMDELDELKKKRMEEFQKQFDETQAEEQELQKQIDAVETIVKSKMTREALERYGNLKTAHPERAVQAATYFVQMIQAGKVSEITDQLLKDVLLKLDQLVGQKDIKITRK